MSRYLTLEPADVAYIPSGVIATENLILRASAIIDGHCKRKITVEPYTERVPLTEMQRGHLSFYPVVAITGLKGRPKFGLTGDNFFGVPQFETIADLSFLDVDKNIGSLWCGSSPFGAPYTELEVTYTSGWDPIPDEVKVVCGLLIGLLVNNPNSNVKSKKDFDFSIEYFGNSMVTPEMAGMLSKYVHTSMR